MNAQPQLSASDGFDQFAIAADNRLASCDIALLNLVAARGLPSTESVDIPACLEKLDSWACRVRIETLRHLYRFDPRGGEPASEFHYGNSLGRFLCYFLLQVLQEDCGVRYNPARKFHPDFCLPADLFIHGILEDTGAGGTCASMPVVYVAVGRRLGYPLRLVEARGHFFFRWDAPQGSFIRWPNLDACWLPPDRFNVEGAGEGIAYYPDSHYIQWPELWTEVDFAHGRYLRSLTAREELAAFLIQRGECFWDLQQPDEAMKAYWFARKLVPDDVRYEWLHAKRTRECDEQTAKQLERINGINERSCRVAMARQSQIPLPPARPLRIAFGTPIPNDLPPGTPIQYVPPDRADSLPPAGARLPGHQVRFHRANAQPLFLDALAMVNKIREPNPPVTLEGRDGAVPCSPREYGPGSEGTE
jgi:hypothetical protein